MRKFPGHASPFPFLRSALLGALAAWWMLPAAACAEPSTRAQGGATAETSQKDTVVRIDVSRPVHPRSRVDDTIAADDPTFGGWETEALSDLAGRGLGDLAARIERRAPELPDWVSDDYSGTALRPGELQLVFEDPVFSVHRPRVQPSAPTARHDRAGLAAALRDLEAALGPGDERHVKFKLYKVEVSGNVVTTRAFYDASAVGSGGGIQQHAEWRLRWTRAGDGLSLRSIEVQDYEETHTRLAGGTLFADATRAALASTPDYEGRVLRGVMHWVERIPRFENVSIFGHAGLAVGDVNNDGLEDLYVCDEGGLPNRLYVQQPDGSLHDVSAGAGVDWLERSFSALLVDLDDDGDEDLAVATYPRLLLSENDGSGRFTLRARLSAVQEAYALTAADYDEDGDLDLYVTTYGGRGPGAHGEDTGAEGDTGLPVPYHDANNGGPNALLRNEGDFRFVDVTRRVGLDQNNSRFSFAAAWEDFDDDGDLDLYVANDFGRNNLYRNDGGSFVDVAAQAGVEDTAAGMSVSWGDYNRDGQIDLYVGNMFSSAGNRIAYQRNFAPGHSDDELRRLQRTARGNSLFTNLGQGRFRDDSATARVSMGRWAWSSNFADLNNDGWLDLVVANGFLTGEVTDDL